jgi:hypothetical protein
MLPKRLARLSAQTESIGARGVVRTFNARASQLRWSWNPTPWAEIPRRAPGLERMKRLEISADFRGVDVG